MPCYYLGFMDDLTPVDRLRLINDIATKQGTARQLAKEYNATPDELRQFTKDNLAEIKRAAKLHECASTVELTPRELDDLWITKKADRINRYQSICDVLFQDVMFGDLEGSEYATALRELRSYMVTVANELGQLMHRGAGDGGDGDTLAVDFKGIDPNKLR